MRIRMFKNNKKEIIFTESNEFVKNTFTTPKPAYNFIPKWFRNDKNYVNGMNNTLDAIKAGGPGATYKLCVPITDGLSSGYIIGLPASFYVVNIGDKDNYIPFLKWEVPYPICDSQPSEVLASYPVPHGHSNSFFRWDLHWHIKTPRGYSLWITHPSHRYDLPFTTINGFVDTDLYPNRLVLPFFIKTGFEGLIEAGTPIAQILPIKREHWISKKENFNPNNNLVGIDKVKIDYIRTYKKRFWSKKRYE
jgi:hypothetical protein